MRTAEPAGFDDMARSLSSGKRAHNDRPSGSVCDAIVTPTPGQLTLPVLARLAGPGLVVSDDEAMRAVALAFRHLKIVVEPGGAVALAAALFRRDEITGDDVIAVATGGNVDAPMFARALAMARVPMPMVRHDNLQPDWRKCHVTPEPGCGNRTFRDIAA